MPAARRLHSFLCSSPVPPSYEVRTSTHTRAERSCARLLPCDREPREIQELAPRRRTERCLKREASLTQLRVPLPAHARERALGRRAAPRFRIDAEDLRGVEPEDLRLDLRRERRIAVLLLKLRRDLKHPERIDLRLRAAVQNAIGAP